MKSNNRILLATAVLAMAMLACQALSGGSEPEVENPPFIVSTLPSNNEPAPVPTEPEPESNVLFRDDFSSEEWGTGTTDDSSIEYDNNTLRMKVFTENWFVQSWPDSEVYENIHAEVTVINNGTDSTTAFGIMCYKQTTEGEYYFAITPAGEYAIAKSAPGQSDLFLTNNDIWGKSDEIAVNASSYRIGADCGNGTLTLYVDGVLIDSVIDSTYTSGSVALLTWSGEEVGLTTDVSFDDFEISELP